MQFKQYMELSENSLDPAAGLFLVVLGMTGGQIDAGQDRCKRTVSIVPDRSTPAERVHADRVNKRTESA